MELENCKTSDDSNSIYGEERNIYDYTYYMPDLLKQNIRNKIYIWISELTYGSKYPIEGKNIFISHIMDEIGELFRSN